MLDNAREFYTSIKPQWNTIIDYINIRNTFDNIKYHKLQMGKSDLYNYLFNLTFSFDFSERERLQLREYLHRYHHLTNVNISELFSNVYNVVCHSKLKQKIIILLYYYLTYLPDNDQANPLSLSAFTLFDDVKISNSGLIKKDIFKDYQGGQVKTSLTTDYNNNIIYMINYDYIKGLDRGTFKQLDINLKILWNILQ